VIWQSLCRLRNVGVLGVIILIFLLLVPPSGFAQERLSSVIKQIQPSVVTITIYDEGGKAIGQGSGFFINGTGHVITNRHVVNGGIRGEVKTAEGNVYSVSRVIAEDKEGDLIRLSAGEEKSLAFWTAGAYAEGLEFLRRKDYRAALKALTEFLKENPNNKYSANAQYSIGEAHYALGEYLQAHAAFLKVAGQYPNSEVVPASWRMAAASLAYIFVGKFEALNYIAILLNNYPQSEEVIKVRSMLGDWGNEGNPYVGQKGFLSNLRKVTLTINGNDALMTCANPEWKPIKPSGLCQNGEALFMEIKELKSMILDVFHEKLPSVAIDEPELVGIGRGYVPKDANQQDWIPVSVYVGSTVQNGNTQFFGVVSVLVARSKSIWNKNPWRGKIPTPHEQSEEHGIVHYFSGSRQTIKVAIQRSLDRVFTILADHWQRDNPKPSMSLAGPIPRFWKHPSNGQTVEIQIEGDYLIQNAKQGQYRISEDQTEILIDTEIETNCQTKRDGSEWTGTCRYAFTGRNLSACFIEAKEIVTLLTASRIEGKSQIIDYFPLRQTPPTCPKPGSGSREFTLVPNE
jgi:hypothetical protein